MICPLCNREINENLLEKHHLIPKTFGGRDTIFLDKCCHQKIHSVFTERELLNHYNTFERILENEDIKTFVKWISKKEPEFYISHDDTNTRKKKRRN